MELMVRCVRYVLLCSFMISSGMLFTVSDLLQYSSERCSVVAMHGKIVVGAALLSSPHEAYITYLVVRAGWDNSHIATCVAISPYM